MVLLKRSQCTDPYECSDYYGREMSYESASEFTPRLVSKENIDVSGDYNGVCFAETNNLEPRQSAGRTCIWETNYMNSNYRIQHRSSQTVSSWILVNNLSRLEMAHKYLTPIIDDIISRATNYTQDQFKDMLFQGKPICAISYTQYVRAYRASRIISEVGKDFASVHNKIPYPQDLIIAPVSTVKREDLLTNVEQMADRILIDRELMKQLVDLHELITDTIKKLKFSLNQVSLEDMPMETHKVFHNISSFETEKLDAVDRAYIRNDVADNFIVVGEPKNRCCIYDENQEMETQKYTNPTYKEQMVLVRSESLERMERNKPRKRKSKCSTCLNCRKCKSSKKKAANRERTRSGHKDIDMDRGYETQHEYPKDQMQMYKIRNDRCPTVPCTPHLNEGHMTIKELQDIVNKRASYTVGPRQYQLKCDNDRGNACAVLPMDKGIVSDSTDVLHGRQEARSLVIAESDSLVDQSDAQLESASPKPVPRRLEGAASCSKSCQSNEDAECLTEYYELRKYFRTIAEQLEEISDYVSFDDIDYSRCDFEEIAEEYQVLQQTLFCLKEYLHLKETLMKLNFSEVDAVGSDNPFGCCYNRDYMHVHCEVLGIPIAVKITQSLLETLIPKFLPQMAIGNTPGSGRRDNGNSDNAPKTASVKKQSKACGCKPVTLKRLLKEKCALRQMMRTRNTTPANNNKIVMMTVDPFKGGGGGAILPYNEPVYDIFEMVEIQDSHSSLPYVVTKQSLPNVNVCPPKKVPIRHLKKRMRTLEIEHPKTRITHRLKNIGVEKLIKASMPAKCCYPSVINESENDEHPLRASLNSLPLTTSDLQLITDVAEADYPYEICKYRPNNFYYFKFECYTNFQENFASNYNYFIPKTRVYQIFYFEIFRKDTNTSAHNTSNISNTHRMDVPRRYNTATNSSSSQYPQATYETKESHQTCGQSRPQSRGIIAEFLRRFMFNSERNDGRQCEDDDIFPKEKVRHKRVRTHHRRERSKEYHASAVKKVRNRRLQATPADLNRHLHETTIEEVAEDEEEVLMNDAFRYNTISASIKNYTVSRVGDIESDRIPSQKVAKKQNENKTSHFKEGSKKRKTPKAKSVVHMGVQFNPKRRCAVHIAQPSYASKRARQYASGPRDCSDNSSSHSYIPESDNSYLNIPPDKLNVTNANKVEHGPITLKSAKENLGTIYETDEKTVLPEENLQRSPYSSFYDFLRSPTVSKSFSPCLSTDKVIDSLENNEIGPEQFWSMYFKARRSAHQSGTKSISLTSTEESAYDQPRKLNRKMRSRIPKRIPHSDSSSDVLSVTESRLGQKVGVRSSPAKKPNGAKLNTSRIKKPLPLSNTSKENQTSADAREYSNKAKIYFKEILDETVRNEDNDIVSIQSLQVLASKNGPGYITVLHPICGCPEVSIFIPCYCNENNVPKHPALSQRTINKLLADKDGRHIILPEECRIPRLPEKTYVTKKYSKMKSNKGHPSETSP